MTSSPSATVSGDGADVSIAHGVRAADTGPRPPVSAGFDIASQTETPPIAQSVDTVDVPSVVGGSQVGSVLWDKFMENPLPSIFGGVIVVMLGFVLTVTNDRISDTNDRITSLEVKVDKKMDALEVKVDALEVKVDEKIDALEVKVDEKIDALEVKVDALDEKIDAIKLDLAVLIAKLDEASGL